MSLDRSTAIIVALVGILILTAAAASIADPAATGDGFGVPEHWSGEQPDPDDTDDGLIDRGSGEGIGGIIPGGETLCFPILFQWEVQLFIIGSLLLGGLLLWWRTGLLPTIAVLTAIVPMGVAVFLAIRASCRTSGQDEFAMGIGGMVLGEDNGNETSGGAVEIATDPIVMLLILAAVGLLAIGIVVLREDVPRDASFGFGAAREEEEEDRIELARIAGEAAERLKDRTVDDAGLENEIYRAWVEMTDQLEVDDPDTSTPGEFAIEAIETGMDAEDVHDLTELFEMVRYGGESPTEAREQEAIEILTRIETSYGESP